MKTFVVNLKRRADRREVMESTLPEFLDVTFTSDWSGPFDGLELDPTNLPIPFGTYDSWQLPFASGHRYWDRPLQAGEIGCTLSHLHVWQRVAREADPCLVLEDDVQLDSSFASRCGALTALMDARPNGPGLVYLGRSGVGPEPAPVDGLVRHPGFSYGSFGYLLSPVAAQSFVDTALPSHIIPADEFLPAMYMDHPRPDIRMLFPKTTTAMAVVPPIVSTDGSMGSDSESQRHA